MNLNSYEQEEESSCASKTEGRLNSLPCDSCSQSQSVKCFTDTDASGVAFASKSSSEINDPYSYLSRGDYTSEAFKLELMNLPKRFGIAVSLLYCVVCNITVRIIPRLWLIC
jgi:hypothetical protein